jgi:Rel/ankyrin family protein
MHQPIGSSPYSPESSHSSSSPISHSFSSGNSPMMCASPNSAYMGNQQFFFNEFMLKLCKIWIHLITGNSPSSIPIRPGRLSPCLSILNQPQGKFRFRYASEMTGTHGCLMAESKERNKKEYIRVQVCFTC